MAAKKKQDKEKNRSFKKRVATFFRYKKISKKSDSNRDKLPSIWKLIKRTAVFHKRLWLQTFGLVIIHSIGIYLLESPSTSDQIGVDSILSVLVFMAYVWIARQSVQDEPELKIKQALYRGPAQLVPFVVLTVIIGLQALPFSIGGLAFQLGVNSSPPIAILYWEKLLFVAAWALLAIPTLYWVLPSLLGLLVVCLPGVGPLQARKAAQQLIHGRTLKVWIKLFWLLLLYGAVVGGVIVGLITWLPQTAVYILTYGGAVLLPIMVYQLFVLYQSLRETSGD
jgi:hypothetical protein